MIETAIPQPPPWPFIGNMLDLDADMTATHAYMADKYGGLNQTQLAIEIANNF